jgi:hypothetical protein
LRLPYRQSARNPLLIQRQKPMTRRVMMAMTVAPEG